MPSLVKINLFGVEIFLCYKLAMRMLADLQVILYNTTNR